MVTSADTMILSLANVKGGVGKTTTAVNLAAAFARSGLRILLVDLDPQGSASFSLGLAAEDRGPSIADALVADRPLAGLIRASGVEGIDLVSGSIELAGADLALARRKNPERRLAGALAPVRRRYDAIVVDCPPGLSLVAVNGLVASTACIVPAVPQDLALEGLRRFFAGWQRLRGAIRGRPQLLGVVLTMVDQRTYLTEEMVTEIRKSYGRDVFRTEIPINVKLAEAPGFGQTIFDYQSWSPGARAYARLGAETIRRARQRGLI